MGRTLDEDDIRSRPGRGKSRPRTKDRPEHGAALRGVVTTIDRGRFQVQMTEVGSRPEPVNAIKARDLGRKGIVVGDQVDVVGTATAGPDSPARIVRRLERVTVLRRSADDDDPTERVIVANATQLAIVTATTNPEPRLGLIDRAVIAADDAGIGMLIIVTKCDLASSDQIRRAYGPLGVDILEVRDRTPTQALIDRLTDQVTVVVGASGVGKSTLVNALAPQAERSTGHVNAVTGKGRHTSTSVEAIALDGGGWIIDTPGVRSFGLAHVPPSAIIRAFPDLNAVMNDCPRDCGHDRQDCALLIWAADQPAAVQERIASVAALLAGAHLRAQQHPND